MGVGARDLSCSTPLALRSACQSENVRSRRTQACKGKASHGCYDAEVTGSYLQTCSQCGRHIPATLWYMHAHNPRRVRCRSPQCREPAVGYCGNEFFDLDSSPLCGAHLMEHRRQGHDVRFVDGGVCGVCDGHGQVLSQGAPPGIPGGRRARCPKCQGAGYTSEAPDARRRRTAGPASTGTNAARSENRTEQETRWAEANRRREEEARRAKERADRERAANEARRREENRRASDEARRRAEEAGRAAEEARQRTASNWRTQNNDWDTARSNVPCPTCQGVGRVPTRFHDALGIPLDPSPEEIGSAFRQKAMQYHPDRNAAPDAGERMKEINEARRLLSRSADIRAGQECPQCHGRRTVANAGSQTNADTQTNTGAQAGAGSERNRQENERRTQASAQQADAQDERGRERRDSGKRTSGGVQLRWFVSGLLLIAVLSGGAYFWETSQQTQVPLAPVQTPRCEDPTHIVSPRGDSCIPPTPTPIPTASPEPQHGAPPVLMPDSDGTPIVRPHPTATPILTPTPRPATPTPAPINGQEGTRGFLVIGDLTVAVFESITDAQRNVSPEGVRTNGSITAGDVAYMASGASPRHTYADGTLYISNQQNGANAALITAALDSRSIGDDICGVANARNQRSDQQVRILLAPASGETTQAGKKFYQGILYIGGSTVLYVESPACNDYYTSGVNAPQILPTRGGDRIIITVKGVVGRIEVTVQ